MTFPMLGLQVGVPDQEPQLKPRLPLSMMTFDNHYSKDFPAKQLAEYDHEVSQYYDLRDTHQRIDSFTNQINGSKLQSGSSKRDELVQALHNQGLALDLNK